MATSKIKQLDYELSLLGKALKDFGIDICFSVFIQHLEKVNILKNEGKDIDLSSAPKFEKVYNLLTELTFASQFPFVFADGSFTEELKQYLTHYEERLL